MAVKIFLSSSLRRYAPCYDPLAGIERTLDRSIRVRDLCKDLGIPAETVKIVMINGKRAGMDAHVAEDDRVALFPPVGGG
jgi:molybdopterin synthase sulfur carrier subunit